MAQTTRPASLATVLLLLTACSDGSNNSFTSPPDYNFDTVDAQLQQFLDESRVLDGISVILVDAT